MVKDIDQELPKGQSVLIQTLDDEDRDIELEIKQPTFQELLHVYTLKEQEKLTFHWQKKDLIELGIEEVFGLYEHQELKAISGGRWVNDDYMLVQMERLDRNDKEVMIYKAFPIIAAFLSTRCLNNQEDGWFIIESKSNETLIDYYLQETNGIDAGAAPYKESVRLIVVNPRRQEELTQRIIKGQRRTHHHE
ncbi:hypothetical protein [uncultured Marinococcus sp.]|jgi:hypothetical protein|uniref:hypothetical protein n=1 Tax=uncultured Marinococcus sp. TaxID=487012 RepID=UPI002626717F|nr:hypothetical protein [uncultured Marinococcus sp.]